MKFKKKHLSIISLTLIITSSSTFAMLARARRLTPKVENLARAALRARPQAVFFQARTLSSRAPRVPLLAVSEQIRSHSTHSSNLDLDKKRTAHSKWESSKGIYQIVKDPLAVGRQVHIAINWHLEAHSKKSILEYVDQKGQTALHIAAEKSSCQCFRDLIAAVDQEGINKKDKQGNTALHVAIKAKSKYGIQALVYVTDLTLRNNLGQTPQSLANKDQKTKDWFSEALEAKKKGQKL